MDLAERLAALSELNERPLDVPAPVTPSYTDAEAKDIFLSELENGATVPEAATRAQRTASWFRRRRNPSARVYDVDFSMLYDEIMSAEGPNREALSQRAFAALVRACEEGNVRAAEKILAAYHADFQWLRPIPTQGDVYNVERLVQIMPGVPTELLLQVRESLVAQRELPVIEQ